MNKPPIQYLLIILWMLYPAMSNAQTAEDETQEDEIHTEVISVSKSFTPTVRKARRIKPKPNLEKQKKVDLLVPEYEFKSYLLETEYDLPSISEIKQEKKDTVQRKHNYIHFGMGNYISPEFNGFGTYQTPVGLFDVFLKYHSAQKSVEQLTYSNAYANALADLMYRNNFGAYELYTNLNYENQSFSYFGIGDSVLHKTGANSINAKQMLSTLKASVGVSNIKSTKGFAFRGIGVDFTYFSDDFSNKTAILSASTGVQIPIQDEHIALAFQFDQFTNEINLKKLIAKPEDYNKTTIHRYSINPNFEVVRDQLKFDLGLKAMFRQDDESGESDFEIYPNVSVVYAFVEELHIGYASIKGEMQENTFWSMTKQANKFFSPIHHYGYTSVKADINLGVKGLLMPQLTYKLDINGRRVNNRQLTNMSYNSDNQTSVEQQLGYLNANSSTALRDTAWLYQVSAELNYNTQYTQTGMKVKFSLDQSDNFSQEFANSQGYGINLYNKIIFNKSWTWINEFYTEFGRNFAKINTDQKTAISSVLRSQIDYDKINITDIVLDDLIDLNTQLWFTFKQDLSIFLKLSNFINNKYEVLPNTNVIGFQVFSGLTYQF